MLKLDPIKSFTLSSIHRGFKEYRLFLPTHVDIKLLSYSQIPIPSLSQWWFPSLDPFNLPIFFVSLKKIMVIYFNPWDNWETFLCCSKERPFSIFTIFPLNEFSAVLERVGHSSGFGGFRRKDCDYPGYIQSCDILWSKIRKVKQRGKRKIQRKQSNEQRVD